MAEAAPNQGVTIEANPPAGEAAPQPVAVQPAEVQPAVEQVAEVAVEAAAPAAQPVVQAAAEPAAPQEAQPAPAAQPVVQAAAEPAAQPAVEIQPEPQPEPAQAAPSAVVQPRAEEEKKIENEKVIDDQPQSGKEKEMDLEKKALTAEQQAQEAKMRLQVTKLFNMADKDGNGSLSSIELKDFLMKQIHLNEEETEYLFNKFDKDDDQKIDEEEFIALMTATSKIAVDTALEGISSSARCLLFLNCFAICCCLCTSGLSCIPYCCYRRHLSKSIDKKIKQAIVAHAKE